MTMPVLLPDLPSGPYTVVSWLRDCGDRVEYGQPLLIVANERFEFVIPALQAGMLEDISALAGASARPGDILATIAPPESAAPLPRITPLARRIAAAHNVDLGAVVGSGDGGRITSYDVRPVPAPALLDTTALRQQPAAIRAAQFVEDSVPTGWSMAHVQAERLLAANADQPQSAARSILAAVAEATVRALIHHPRAAAYWREQGLAVPRQVRLLARFADGAAVLVPRAAELNRRGMTRVLNAGPGSSHAPPSPHITISETAGDIQFGHYGVAVPQLLVSHMRVQPVVLDDQAGERVGMQRVCTLIFAYDARVLTYAEADRFLAAIVQHLQSV